jgi:capsid protein
MNFLDRAISFVSPTAGVSRGIARQQLKLFGYDAATPGNNRGRSGGATKNASSENWKSSRDRVAMMWDARDVVRNFAILRGIVTRIVQYTVDRVQYVSQTGDEQIDSQYQDYFHAWCEKADITGRHRLGDLTWMAFWGMLVDGDHGWNLVESEYQGERRIVIQPIEADRIGNVYNPAETNEGNKIGGVIVDDVGRPQEYAIYKRGRLNVQYSFDQNVPAGQFVHLFDPFRVDQYRGITALATAIAPARDLYEVYHFEKLAAKWQIGHAGMIRTPDPFKSNGVSAWDGAKTTANNAPGTVAMEAGKILRLNAGEEITFAPGTNRPSGAFMALVQVMVREISMGVNLPYGFLYDMTAFGGHTARVEIAQAMRGIRRYQRLISEHALDPVRDAVLGRAISLGELPPHPDWRKGRWGYGASLTGDYGNDTSANLSLLNAGLVTASDLIAETGQSFEEITRRQASEVAYMQRVSSETGVPIELLNNRLANPSATLAAMNTPPQPPAGLVEAGADVKPLIEILKNVGDGIMDRKSAVAAIIQLYGLPQADVEKMVPEQGSKEEAAEA